MKQFTNLLLLAIVASIFASCATTKKQRAKALTFFAEHPQELSEICGKQYPPIIKPGKDSIAHDTTFTPGDSVPCPGVVIKTEKGKDSIVYRYAQCPPQPTVTITHTRIDTVENTGKIAAFQFRQDSLITLLGIRTAERDEAKKQANTRLFWLLGLIGVIGVGVFLRLKKII